MVFCFYDTCALLDQLDTAFNDPSTVMISNITLKELENIKTSSTKDEDIKYKARKLIHLLDKNLDKIKIISYNTKWDKELIGCLSDNADSRIILSALHASKVNPIIFITHDLYCRQLAKSIGLNVEYHQKQEAPYKGFLELKGDTDFFIDIYSTDFNPNNFNLYLNEYLFLRDFDNNLIDRFNFKWIRKIKLSYF